MSEQETRNATKNHGLVSRKHPPGLPVRAHCNHGHHLVFAPGEYLLPGPPNFVEMHYRGNGVFDGYCPECGMVHTCRYESE